jgi:hypothetical protein
MIFVVFLRVSFRYRVQTDLEASQALCPKCRPGSFSEIRRSQSQGDGNLHWLRRLSRQIVNLWGGFCRSRHFSVPFHVSCVSVLQEQCVVLALIPSDLPSAVVAERPGDIFKRRMGSGFLFSCFVHVMCDVTNSGSRNTVWAKRQLRNELWACLDSVVLGLQQVTGFVNTAWGSFGGDLFTSWVTISVSSGTAT